MGNTDLIGKSDTVYVESAVTIASGDGTQIGPDIPDGKTRYVWRIIATGTSTAQDLAIYQGDDSDQDRYTKMRLAVVNTVDIGGDPEKPVMIIRPIKSSGSTTGNQIRVAHETSAIKVTMNYYDLP